MPPQSAPPSHMVSFFLLNDKYRLPTFHLPLQYSFFTKQQKILPCNLQRRFELLLCVHRDPRDLACQQSPCPFKLTLIEMSGCLKGI